MSARQDKRARSIAMREARRQKIWDKCKTAFLSKWWRKFLAKHFPKYAKKIDNAVGRWFKRQLKTWTKQVKRSVHDPDIKAFAAAKRKIARQQRIEFAKKDHQIVQ